MLEPLPTIRPPRRPENRLERGLPVSTAFHALAAGWRDLTRAPLGSLAYGLGLFVLSVVVLWVFYHFHLLYLALPALAGFMILGPFLAIGLYRKSHALSHGHSFDFGQMRHARAAAGGQIAFAGLMLCLLLLFWLRAADLLYALYFGLIPFPGYEEAFINTFTTFRGWMLILTGGFVGAFFAGFAFSISLYAIPLLVFERRDALGAMGLSFGLVMRNFGPSLAWGVIVTLGIALSIMTGLLGLIVIFPILGHGTWHMFHAIYPQAD